MNFFKLLSAFNAIRTAKPVRYKDQTVLLVLQISYYITIK